MNFFQYPKLSLYESAIILLSYDGRETLKFCNSTVPMIAIYYWNLKGFIHLVHVLRE